VAKINYTLILILAFIFSSEIAAQSKDINGVIKANGDLDRIHIINQTASKFTITNTDGEFMIPAKLGDTILVSSVQYVVKKLVVSELIMQTQQLTLNLEDNVNLLDQVVVGKILTGDLMTDVENSDAKRELNFYDLGIPGYTGRRKTQTERRIYEAQSGGGIVPLNPLINWITGRTKRLKEQKVRHELEVAITETKAKYASVIFENETFDAHMQNEYFYFCSDDPKFKDIYARGIEIETLQYLKDKLVAFKKHLEND